MSVSFEHRVKYHEVDQQGYLFNARYVDIADVALTEFFRELGYSYPQLNKAGVDPSVVNMSARFTAPARFDDVLDVTVGCTRVGRSSFELATSFDLTGSRVAELSLVYVNVHADAAIARPLPEPIAEQMREAVTAANGQQLQEERR